MPSAISPTKYTHLIWNALHHRSLLASAETRTAINHILITGLFIVGTGALTLLASIAGILAIAVWVWSMESGGWILAAIGLSQLTLAVTCGCIARRRLRTWSPFPYIREQLASDYTLIERLYFSK